MTALVRREPDRGFDCLIIDSPHNRNAMSLRLLDELTAGIVESAQSDNRGLVLTHIGPVFCAGIDLRERRLVGPEDNSHSTKFAQLLTELWNYPKPVVAVVDGAVRGGGMGLLACSDLVEASPSSTFGYSEVKVGVAPALVLGVTLHSLPARPLLTWLLSGATFDARTALQLGLVTAISAAPGESRESTVDSLRNGAPGAQSTVKRLVRAAASIDIGATLSELAGESAVLFQSMEAREGMAAFVERRAPVWAATDTATRPARSSR